MDLFSGCRISGRSLDHQYKSLYAQSRHLTVRASFGQVTPLRGKRDLMRHIRTQFKLHALGNQAKAPQAGLPATDETFTQTYAHFSLAIRVTKVDNFTDHSFLRFWTLGFPPVTGSLSSDDNAYPWNFCCPSTFAAIPGVSGTRGGTCTQSHRSTRRVISSVKQTRMNGGATDHGWLGFR